MARRPKNTPFLEFTGPLAYRAFMNYIEAIERAIAGYEQLRIQSLKEKEAIDDQKD